MSEGPIYWHQGLFLQPQHFQILQTQMEGQLSPLLPRLAPFFWGLVSGGLNPASLAAGRLEISELSLLFPGSSQILTVPGNAVCAGRSVNAASIPAGGSLRVFAGVRVLRPEEANVTVVPHKADMGSVPTRLVTSSVPDRVADMYAGGPVAEVQRLTHVLHFVFEDELDQVGMMEQLPLARLLRQEDRIVLDTEFTPPCLSLCASPLLSRIFKEIRDWVLGKARQLEGYRNLSLGTVESSEVTFMLMALRTLSRFTIRMDHMGSAPFLSPWNAYGLLAELAAELSVFSLHTILPGEHSEDDRTEGERGLAPYSHDNPGPCFLAIREILLKLLDGISAGPRFVTNFDLQADYRTARIPRQILDETQSSGSEYWMVLHSGTLQAEALALSASRMLKLAATERMESLLVRALPGLALSLSKSPPPGMPRRQGAVYFRIHREGTLWPDVEKSGSLSLHWPEAPEDLDAQLAVLMR